MRNERGLGKSLSLPWDVPLFQIALAFGRRTWSDYLLQHFVQLATLEPNFRTACRRVESASAERQHTGIGRPSLEARDVKQVCQQFEQTPTASVAEPSMSRGANTTARETHAQSIRGNDGRRRSSRGGRAGGGAQSQPVTRHAQEQGAAQGETEQAGGRGQARGPGQEADDQVGDCIRVRRGRTAELASQVGADSGGDGQSQAGADKEGGGQSQAGAGIGGDGQSQAAARDKAFTPWYPLVDDEPQQITPDHAQLQSDEQMVRQAAALATAVESVDEERADEDMADQPQQLQRQEQLRAERPDSLKPTGEVHNHKPGIEHSQQHTNLSPDCMHNVSSPLPQSNARPSSPPAATQSAPKARQQMKQQLTPSSDGLMSLSSDRRVDRVIQRPQRAISNEPPSSRKRSHSPSISYGQPSQAPKRLCAGQRHAASAEPTIKDSLQLPHASSFPCTPGARLSLENLNGNFDENANADLLREASPRDHVGWIPNSPSTRLSPDRKRKRQARTLPPPTASSQRQEPSAFLAGKAIQIHDKTHHGTHDQLLDQTQDQSNEDSHDERQDNGHSEGQDKSHNEHQDENHDKNDDERHEENGDEHHDENDDERHDDDERRDDNADTKPDEALARFGLVPIFLDAMNCTLGSTNILAPLEVRIDRTSNCRPKFIIWSTSRCSKIDDAHAMVLIPILVNGSYWMLVTVWLQQKSVTRATIFDPEHDARWITLLEWPISEYLKFMDTGEQDGIPLEMDECPLQQQVVESNPNGTFICVLSISRLLEQPCPTVSDTMCLWESAIACFKKEYDKHRYHKKSALVIRPQYEPPARSLHPKKATDAPIDTVAQAIKLLRASVNSELEQHEHLYAWLGSAVRACTLITTQLHAIFTRRQAATAAAYSQFQSARSAFVAAGYDRYLLPAAMSKEPPSLRAIAATIDQVNAWKKEYSREGSQRQVAFAERNKFNAAELQALRKDLLG
ncbi:hypothetical protein EJ03DRAFT_331015 [Teratosphaeria nubilosa]|uniref:Uncharacterized protein n=1 Tax=Teratosphaeria nubilosa TaxID=161662 RepID=A0A6G1KZH8_9PEZI|nr:hypothetical protein EJ03DRAFT_331015 [Teratosphaeria nubilosa]